MNNIKRLLDKPIIEPEMKGLEGDKGGNINGPSLIKVPDWINNRLGKYYLYFAHHGGDYIRLAYSDNLQGPWKIHEPGTLKLEQSPGQAHVASPDVHLDSKNKQILMYFHSPSQTNGIYSEHGQLTYLALSNNGLDFQVKSEVVAPFYFRRFKYNDYYYGIAKNKNKGGLLLRGKEPHKTFEYGKKFIKCMRHAAVYNKGDILYVFYSRIGDKPERILMSRVNLNQNWLQWEPSSPEEILKSETEYEGVDLIFEKSQPGSVNHPVHQLRDPAVFEEDDNLYLLYSVAGENGIAVAKFEKNIQKY